MKIAILHSGDLEHISMGGVDRYVKSIIEFFPDGEITVFGTGEHGKVETGASYAREYHGKKYTFIPLTTDKRHPLSVFYMLKEFSRVNALCKYDCIYAQRTEYSIPFLFSSGKKKLIQLIHGSSKYSKMGFGSGLAIIHLFFERISVGIAERTYVILNREEYGVPYYKSKYKKYADRFYYQRNPINAENFKRMDKAQCKKEIGIAGNEIGIIFVGRVEHNPKRVLLFPEIVNEIKKAGYKVKFVVVGDGKDKDELYSRVQKSNLDEDFIFTGYVEDTDRIAFLYNAADAAINISMFEGTCTSNLEAIATGIPVISTDVGDIREVINNGFNGTIIENSEDESQIVKDAAKAIIDAFVDKIPINDNYLKYSGSEVAKQLRDEMCEAVNQK